MKQVPLTQVANQAVSFNAGTHFWKIHVFQNLQMMLADITRDGVLILSGVRCFGGIPLLPYGDLYGPDSGNFIFDKDADWTEFGVECRLFYLDSSEYATYHSLLTRK